MTPFTLENPVFATYIVTSALMVLKIMGQGWMTVWRLMRSGEGLASPEDLRPGPLNRDPKPEQLQLSDYVDRSRRMHRNDLENIPAFLVAGLLLVAVGPDPVIAAVLMWTFVAARFAHAVAYATAQSHEMRATFYTIGSVVVIVMAIWALVAAL